MTTILRTRAAALAALLAATLGTAACSFGAHPTVSEATVEQTVSDRLFELVGQRPEAVDCPGELDGVVGTTLRCELTTGTERYPVTLTVTRVEGATVNFDFEVGESPLP